ncbi:MAG: ribonuclease domain-containing protein, partial [Nocardioides sp.]
AAGGGAHPRPDRRGLSLFPGQDGGAFLNREQILPDRPEGYREYTVRTPGSDDRGARRIVTGDGGEYSWTDDHYASFARIER